MNTCTKDIINSGFNVLTVTFGQVSALGILLKALEWWIKIPKCKIQVLFGTLGFLHEIKPTKKSIDHFSNSWNRKPTGGYIHPEERVIITFRDKCNIRPPETLLIEDQAKDTRGIWVGTTHYLDLLKNEIQADLSGGIQLKN